MSALGKPGAGSLASSGCSETPGDLSPKWGHLWAGDRYGPTGDTGGIKPESGAFANHKICVLAQEGPRSLDENMRL
jgi:hypothetical protein